MDVGRLSAGTGGGLALGSGPSAAAGLSQRREDFLTALGRRGAQAGLDPAARARAAAEDFVSIAFVQPILKEVRQSDKTPPPWGPGPAEKHLRGLLDSATAQSVVRSARFGLVDRLASDLLSRSAVAAGREDAQGKGQP